MIFNQFNIDLNEIFNYTLSMNKKNSNSLVPYERILKAILVLRGQKVMLDADLAELYGVSTKRLNEQVRRNQERFPSDFMFSLNAEEKKEVVAICDHLWRLKFSSTRPKAFTEYGAVMLATVLSTPFAVQMGLQVVRAFVRLREIFTSHKELARKVEEMEKKCDANFRVLYRSIQKLINSKPRKRDMIGFHP